MRPEYGCERCAFIRFVHGDDVIDSDGTKRAVNWSIPEFRTPNPHVPHLVGLFTGRRVDGVAGLTPLRDDEIRGDRENYRARSWRTARRVAGQAVGK